MSRDKRLLLDQTEYHLLLDKTLYSTKMIFHPPDRTNPSLKIWVMGTPGKLCVGAELVNCSREDETWYYDPWRFSFMSKGITLYFRGRRHDHVRFRAHNIYHAEGLRLLWDWVHVICTTHLYLTETLIPVFVAIVQWKPGMKDSWRELRQFLNAPT